MYSHLVIEEAGPLVHTGCDESLHRTELQYNNNIISMYSHLVIEEAGPLVYTGCDETLHCAELQYNNNISY